MRTDLHNNTTWVHIDVGGDNDENPFLNLVHARVQVPSNVLSTRLPHVIQN
jgi:hypothetical protein